MGTITLEEIEGLIKEFFPEEISEEWLNENLGKGHYDLEALNNSLNKPIWEFLKRGGKRIRPRLMLLCCKAVGGKKEDIEPFLPIPELIHNGTLMIDDIEDKSELRRGKLPTYKLFGTAIAVNAGNAMYFLPLLIMKKSSLDVSKKTRIYAIIVEEMTKLSFGQGTDIYWAENNKIPTEEQYFQMCSNKTGLLMRIAAKLGAIIGNGTEEQIELLGDFSGKLGVAFQILDDALDLTPSEKWGKPLGQDITEGKRSLIIIKTLEKAKDTDKKRLLHILGMHTKDKELIEEAIKIIEKYDSIKYAKGVAVKMVKDAWKTADNVLPESDAKQDLKKLAEFFVEREV